MEKTNIPTELDNLNEIENKIEEISISDKSSRHESDSKYGMCEECRKENTWDYWCLSCSSLHFQQNFDKWTSGNKQLDEIIRESQLNCTSPQNILEWIPYSHFENITYIDEGGFGKIYSATWKEGYIYGWDFQQKQFERRVKREVH